LVAALLAVSWACAPVARAADLTVYVANTSGAESFGSLEALDATTNALEGSLAMPNPRAIAFTPDGTSAYVANEEGNGAEHGFLMQAKVAEKEVGARISTIEDPWAIAIAPDGAKAYVVNYEPPHGGLVPVTLSGDVVGSEVPVADADAVAVAPDGSTAYVVSGTSGAKGSVTPIDLSDDKAETAIPVGTTPVAIAITPDGSTAYVVNQGSETVTPIDLADGKAETAIALPNVAYASSIAMAPNGLTAYVAVQENSAHSNDAAIEPIDLLDDEPQTPILDGQKESPIGLALAPDGETAYVTELAGTLVPVDLADETAGAPINVAPGYEVFPDTSAVAVQPDQAPAAAFSDTPAPPGSTTKFNASASTASFGSIATYEWEFGDGSKATTSNAEITHVYKEAKTYKAKLTVTDSNGTSTEQVYTGQMMVRDGGPGAAVEHSVVVSSGGGEPEAHLGESSLAFGEVQVGQASGAIPLTVENDGSAALAIEGHPQLAGADPRAFEVTSDACAEVSLAPGETCVVDVRFIPQAPGVASAKLELRDNANGSPQSVTLGGSGTAPSAQLSSARLNFGQIASGDVSSSQTVTLTNAGQAPLHLAASAVTLGGSQPGAFKLTGDGCSGQTLQPAGSCSVTVAFAPTQASTSYAATLAFADNASGSPQSLALEGSSAPPPPPADVTVSPDSLQFYGAGGKPSVAQAVLVANPGDQRAHITSVSLGGASPTAFAVTADGCSGQTLEPQGASTCTIAVQFVASEPGQYFATLLIGNDAPDGTQTVALSGSTSGTITGKVLNAADGDAPLAGAFVSAYQVFPGPGPQAPSEGRFVHTNADGSYTFTGLAAGTWHIEVFPEQESLADGSTIVELGSTGAAVANLELRAPQPLSGGVSFEGPEGPIDSGVPTVYIGMPFSYKIPVRIGPGTANGTRLFMVLTALGNKGASGAGGGGFNTAAAAFFSVSYDGTGAPAKMSQIVLGQLECGPSGQPSPCGAFAAAAENAGGGAHASAARAGPMAAVLKGGLPRAHAAFCPGGNGFREGTEPGFYLTPTNNNGIKLEVSLVPLQPPVAFVFDPWGLASPAPSGNPLVDAIAKDQTSLVNGLTTAIPYVGGYNTIVQTLSSVVTAIEKPTAGNVINAYIQTVVSQLNVEDHGAAYYFGNAYNGPLANHLETESKTPGNTEHGLTGPGPAPPCEEENGGAGGGGGGGGGKGGAGGGRSGETGSEPFGGEAYLDPSGLVRSSSGIPLAGATVTLTRATSAGGRQLRVPNGSTLMSPSNRRNPFSTSLLGTFAWDVAPGFYQIDARRASCRAPHGGAVERSSVKPVPPPQTGVVLTLRCPALRRTAARLRLALVRGADSTSVLRVSVHARHRLRSKVGAYVGSILVSSGGTTLASTPTDARTGTAVVDLPPLGGAGHVLRVSFSGNALVGPSAASVRVG
jgi:DNA-binding beta-propeller fold protein YncE